MKTRSMRRKMVMRMVLFVAIIHHRLEHLLRYIILSDLHNYGRYAEEIILFFHFLDEMLKYKEVK